MTGVPCRLNSFHILVQVNRLKNLKPSNRKNNSIKKGVSTMIVVPAHTFYHIGNNIANRNYYDRESLQ